MDGPQNAGVSVKLEASVDSFQLELDPFSVLESSPCAQGNMHALDSLDISIASRNSLHSPIKRDS